MGVDVLTIVTLLAVLVALFGKTFWDWRNKPVIKVGFGNNKPYVIDFYSDITLRLFRLKIVNQGKIVAKNCRVRIISVVTESGNTKDCLIDEPDILKWSGVPKDTRYQVQGTYGLIPIDKENKDITPEGWWEFLDLFEIGSREKRITFSSSGRRDFLVENERYFATIEISGDNLKPTKKYIKFSVPYNVDWAKGTMNLANIEEIGNTSQ
ncbi:MAG: hypothetical protein ABIJ58_00990 [Nanoarchaeota archaeon]